MTVKSVLMILLGGAVLNNCVLLGFLGVTPFLGMAKHEKKMLCMSLSVALVMLLTAAASYPVQALLEAKGLGYFQTLAFALIILAVVYLLEGIVKLSGKSLGVYFPMIALNSAVLGLCVNNIAEAYTYAEALINALGSGLGFVLATVLLCGVQERINDRFVPKAFRGLPVTVLAASILSLALFAF